MVAGIHVNVLINFQFKIQTNRQDKVSYLSFQNPLEDTDICINIDITVDITDTLFLAINDLYILHLFNS